MGPMCARLLSSLVLLVLALGAGCGAGDSSSGGGSLTVRLKGAEGGPQLVELWLRRGEETLFPAERDEATGVYRFDGLDAEPYVLEARDSEGVRHTFLDQRAGEEFELVLEADDWSGFDLGEEPAPGKEPGKKKGG